MYGAELHNVCDRHEYPCLREFQEVHKRMQLLRKLFITIIITIVVSALLAIPSWAQSQERLDLGALTRLKSEAYNNSQVMNTVSWLTDIYGPALTRSPSMHNAANFLDKQMKEFGLSNVHQEGFPFGREWSVTRFYIHEIAPQTFPMLGGLHGYSGGTNGWVKGDVLAIKVGEEKQYEGKLQNKIVLLIEPPLPESLKPRPTGVLTDEQLAAGAKTGPPATPALPIGPTPEMLKQARDVANANAKWLVDQGVLAVLRDSRGLFGTVLVGLEQSYHPDDVLGVPQISLAQEHFKRIQRQLEKKVPVTVEMDVQVEADNKMGDAVNVIGEIPGTEKPSEFVMLGGHYDAVSAGSGQGATDDVVGCSTALEAVRLIKAAGLKPLRTVRVACWSGEEEGLLGSRAYVQAHFRDWQTGQLKPEYNKLSVYFNLDNGAGAIRGVHLRANEELFPIFTEWMNPLHNMGMTTLTMKGGQGTDDYSFDLAGLPGFQFYQDPLDYGEHAHHTNMDTYERIPPAESIKNSVIMAFFAWQAANRPEMMPRKPMPTTPSKPASPNTQDSKTENPVTSTVAR